MLPTLRNRNIFPDLLDEFFSSDPINSALETTKSNVPSVNVAEDENEYRIEVAAPGLNKDDFNVNVNNDTLDISSEKEHKDEKKEERFVRREFSYTQFKRSFALPDGVDANNIKAKHDNGVLYVHLPKKEENKQKESKTIKIS